MTGNNKFAKLPKANFLTNCQEHMSLKIKNSNKKQPTGRRIETSNSKGGHFTTSQGWLPCRPMTIKESIGTNVLALHCFRTH